MKLYFIVGFLSCYYMGFAQDVPSFPQNWIGDYAGIMYAHYPTADRIDTIDVHFEIKETDRENAWTYVMSYSNEQYGDIVKSYEIIKPDSLASHMYYLDELDGILIEQPLIYDTFYSNFTVGEVWISSRMRRVESGIEFEITSAKNTATRTSQNRADNPEDVFVVDSYPPFTYQRIFLDEVD